LIRRRDNYSSRRTVIVAVATFNAVVFRSVALLCLTLHPFIAFARYFAFRFAITAKTAFFFRAKTIWINSKATFIGRMCVARKACNRKHAGE
jgi:hypothetical protein